MGSTAAAHTTARVLRLIAASALCAAAMLVAGCTAAEPPAEPPLVTLPPREAAAPVDPVVAYADARLGVMSTREKVASLLMMHLAGTSPDDLAAFTAAHDLGGVILMGDNMPADPADIAGITAGVSEDAGLPVLVGIDQEGGTVRRVRPDPGLAASELRALPAEATEESFAARSALLASLGVSVNFGIVADVTGDESSFIRPRVLGSTAAEAAERVSRAVAGERGSVLSTLKHFPGHGVSPGDSHSSLPSTGMGLEQWRAEHAPPFEAGIDAGAELVMMGHLVFPAVDPEPASLSPRWHEVLRDDLGFDGVIVSDDLAMLHGSGDARYSDPASNAVAALNAGTTMLLFVGGADPARVTDALVAAVDDGRLAIGTVDDAAHRLLVLRRGLAEQSGPYVRCFTECRALLQ